MYDEYDSTQLELIRELREENMRLRRRVDWLEWVTVLQVALLCGVAWGIFRGWM